MNNVVASLLAAALLLLGVAPTSAWAGHPGAHPSHYGYGGAHTRVVIGFGWWGPYWPYRHPYYPPPYYVYPPPPVIVQEPPVYVQPPPPPAPPAAYWYYCASAKAYYPDVQACPEEWIKVPPRTQ